MTELAQAVQHVLGRLLGGEDCVGQDEEPQCGGARVGDDPGQDHGVVAAQEGGCRSDSQYGVPSGDILDEVGQGLRHVAAPVELPEQLSRRPTAVECPPDAVGGEAGTPAAPVDSASAMVRISSARAGVGRPGTMAVRSACRIS